MVNRIAPQNHSNTTYMYAILGDKFQSNFFSDTRLSQRAPGKGREGKGGESNRKDEKRREGKRWKEKRREESKEVIIFYVDKS